MCVASPRLDALQASVGETLKCCKLMFEFSSWDFFLGVLLDLHGVAFSSEGFGTVLW